VRTDTQREADHEELSEELSERAEKGVGVDEIPGVILHVEAADRRWPRPRDGGISPPRPPNSIQAMQSRAFSEGGTGRREP
jgi:hypothetical protein